MDRSPKARCGPVLSLWSLQRRTNPLQAPKMASRCMLAAGRRMLAASGSSHSGQTYIYMFVTIHPILRLYGPFATDFWRTRCRCCSRISICSTLPRNSTSESTKESASCRAPTLSSWTSSKQTGETGRDIDCCFEQLCRGCGVKGGVLRQSFFKTHVALLRVQVPRMLQHHHGI